MNTFQLTEIFRDAIMTGFKVAAPILIVSILVGLVISIIQAATSINEQTLSFLPRLLVTLTALSWGAHWGLQQLLDFFHVIIEQIPEVLG